MARRNRKPLLGRNSRRASSAGRTSQSWPVLGRRKARWRFVGALALAQLGGTAFGQAPPEVIVPGPGMGGPPAYSQNAYSPVSGPGYAGPRGPAPMISPPPMVPSGPPAVGIPIGSTFTPRLVNNNGFGDGLGWEDGYTALGAWVPLGINDDSMVLYMDARGFISYTEGGGGNFTLGYRYYVPDYNRFFGIYGAYDIDNGTKTGSTFHQVVVGGESVGKYLSYRVNGYIPVGDTDSGVFNTIGGAPFFEGNNIFFLNGLQTRYQYGGVDGELGGPLPLIGQYGLSGYLGGYYLTSDVDDTVGFKGRLEANVNDDLQIGAKLTQDDIFDTNLWFTLTVRSPRGSWFDFFQKDWLRQPSVQSQMDRAPERRYRIATDVKTDTTTEIVINPATNNPYVVLHVDPGAGGNGTFENPAGAIRGVNAPGYDIIYVQPGTLASNGPIELFDTQRLLSTAVPHTFATDRGLLALPGFTGGSLPTLRNLQDSPSSVIVLANNNEVSGFRIDGLGGGTNVFHTGITGNSITDFNINQNQFVNTSGGVAITHVGNGQGVLADNTFTGNESVSGPAAGFDITTVDDSFLRMSVTDNTVDNASGAGISLHASENSIITAEVRGNTITNTRDDLSPLTEGNGQGLFVWTTSNGRIVNSVIDNNLFQGNETYGLLFQTSALGAIQNVLVGDVDGNNDSGNVFTANLNGLGLIRTGNAQVDNLRIFDNEFVANVVGNFGNGIDFNIGGGLADVVDVTVASNNMVNNDTGLFAEISSDGILNLTLTNNRFIGNSNDGVQVLENRFTIDEGSITGVWTGNLFADTRLHGIHISARARDLIVGTPAAGNTIIRSGREGIFLNGSGSAVFTNNLITANGGGPDLVDTPNNPLDDITFGAGIDIEGVGFKDMLFVNNRIVDNFGDGVEIEVGTGSDSQSFELEFTDNIVARNSGRGYDVLNKEDSFLDLTIKGTAPGRSVIAENGREGIYVVNTASGSQTQQGPTPVAGNPSTDPTHGMDATGDFRNTPTMFLTITGNEIVGNGIDQTSTVGRTTDAVGGSGLVLRVGTTGGGYGFTNPGGFATSGRGGVIASVTNNFFTGNFGADVYVESFTSTENPPTTGGTWSATEFDPDNYEGDPLARLDLTFTGNAFESRDFNTLGAFYTNDESTFKSRERGAEPEDGPFRSGERRRNAQRVGFRGGLAPTAPAVPGDNFLYAGMGTSTFRITQETLGGTNTLISPDGTRTLVNPEQLFLLDNQSYVTPADASGVLLPGADFGELPYGWSVAP